MENEIKGLLAAVVHPETGKDLVSDGFIEHIASTANKITIVLRFAKTRDPFAGKIRKNSERNEPTKKASTPAKNVLKKFIPIYI